jgi:hypothetical protein
MKITLNFKEGKGDLRVEDFSVDDIPQSGPLKEKLQAIALQFFEAMSATGPDAPPDEVEEAEHDPEKDPPEEE